MTKKPIFSTGWNLPPNMSVWRNRIHSDVQALLKPLFAHAVRVTPDKRKRPAVTIEYRRRYPKKGARGRPQENFSVSDAAAFGEYMPLLDRVFMGVLEPEGTPRAGFSIKIELSKGWQSWVTYVRE